MWLDAFLPKSGTMQKSGVPRVPSVPMPANPIGTRVPRDWGIGTPANVPSVPSVPNTDTGTVRDTRHTAGHQPKNRCPADGKGYKPSVHAGSEAFGTPGTRGTPQKQHEPGIDDLQRQSLAQFGFELVQAEFDAGGATDELCRVNNMAWEFMQVDGLAFSDAIRLAAEIVVSGQVAACEAAYEDVMALWRKVTYA